jgi:anti-sigma factor RsiW
VAKTPDRIEELLVDEATDALTAAGQAELEALLAEHPECDRYGFERAAASVFLAVGAGGGKQMPAELRARLSKTAKNALTPGS